MIRTNAYVAMVYLLCAALAGCGNDGDGGGSTSAARVLDPENEHYGRSYSAWNVEWFKWVYETPYDDNCQLPLDDSSGEHCGVGQSGDVFFLAGNIAADTTVVVRNECVVPTGKALFFPLMNRTADNGGVPPDQHLPDEEIQASVADFLEKVQTENLIASVDGQKIGVLERFKTEVVEFSYELPDEPNFYSCLGAPGVTGTIAPSYAGGYYVLLAPLSEGSHTIRFGLVQPDDLFSSEITYHLTVE